MHTQPAQLKSKFLFSKGMYEEAIAAHQKAGGKGALAVTYALAGRTDEAWKLAAELKKEPTPRNAWGLAQVYAALGEKDEAFRWLEAAYKSRFSFMPWILRNSRFDPLRSDPRFVALLRKIGLEK